MTPTSDVHSLGVIFYECLVGKRPFLGDAEMVLIAQQLTMTADPVAEHRPELADSRLSGLVAAMLEKKPEVGGRAASGPEPSSGLHAQ